MSQTLSKELAKFVHPPVGEYSSGTVFSAPERSDLAILKAIERLRVELSDVGDSAPGGAADE